MYKITHDSLKNRVYVAVEGTLSLTEIPKYTIDFKGAVDKAKPGFTVCVDNTKAGVNPQEVNDKLTESRDYAMSKGLKNSAMVVNSVTFKMQMKRVFKELGNVFETVSDADKFLDTAPDIRTQL